MKWRVVARTTTYVGTARYDPLKDYHWVYRYRWQARLRAWWSKGWVSHFPIAYRTETFIEPYRVGENVIPLRKKA
jgi:hypothetical protein